MKTKKIMALATRKMKKLTIFTLSVAMCLSCGFAVAADMNTAPSTVIAEEAQINGVAKVGETAYDTLAEAVAAANAGDTVTVFADISNETVTVDKNLTITGTATMNNVGINAAGADELTVSGLTFTGNSWINSGTAEKLTVSGVKANVTPSNTSYTNSRSAFISLGRTEGQLLNLTVENCQIVSNGGTDPILGWAAITGATITGNTFGSADAYQWNSDSVKFMAIAEGAVFNVTGNTVYSNYNGFVFGQNTTRGNSYTVNLSGNKFYGGADHVWIEVSDSNTVNATINASSTDTVNGVAFTASDIKVQSKIKTWTSYAGVDMVTNAEGKLISGTVAYGKDNVAVADGYEVQADGSIRCLNAAARVGNVDYQNLEDALKALKAGDTLTLVNDVTIDYKWDNRYTGAKTTVPVIIDGNGKTLKFTGQIADGGNYTAAFRFEKEAIMKNLTIDMSEATSDVANRLKAVSAKLDFTAENCTFIGNSYTNTNAIIFGEGGGAALADVNVSVKNCTFKNWKNGVSDNQNRNDVKTVTISNSTFESASVNVSAVDNVTFTNNTLQQGWVKIVSYTNANNLTATFTGNTLTENGGTDATTNYIAATNVYSFELSVSKTALKASESVNVTVAIDKDYYSAEYTFTYDKAQFSCAADMDSDGVIFVSNLYKGEAGDLATYTLVALNDMDAVTTSDFAVEGKALQAKEESLNGNMNTAFGDVETVKVSLNYTAGVKKDYVQGYSLVLVKGDDEGYAYGGVKMFYVEAYNAYAFLVEGNVTEADIDAKLSKTSGCEIIEQSYNVNAEYVADNQVDIKDATVAYACSVLDFDVAAYMELFLRADVNGDCRVNMVDVNAIVRNYTNR